MALLFTNKTSSAPSNSGTSNNTASLSPTNGNMLLIAIYEKNNSAIAVPTVTGLSLSWITINSHTATQGGSVLRVSMFYAIVSGSPTGAINISGTNVSNRGWSVEEVSGFDTTTPTIQEGSNNGNTNTITVALSALSNAKNAAYCMVGTDGGSGLTVGSGFTQLSNKSGGGQDGAEWKLNDASPSWSWSSSVPVIAMAVEIAAGGGAAGASFLFNFI